ncbi:hypothetical protein [Mycetocola spongiae]|uniref:hypothetical protein n=1 Tax=Mycetocola spongiae TaxID=2859226 RepID=UPI001CF486AC|nr:hypothetical protein [Mycetocola spongiae]UCR88924.1 hypothetical protein KXZ72_13395 [Mycetocola spongiae]
MDTSRRDGTHHRLLGITFLILAALSAVFAVATFFTATAWGLYVAGVVFAALALVLILRGVEQLREG